MAKKYYWLKLKRDFFKRHDIRIIEDMDNGKDYILLYLKLLVESIDHNGDLRFSETVPYSDKMISTITNTNIDIVRSAMKVFKELKFIEVMDDETIFMSQVNDMIGSESEWKNKKLDYRKRKQLKITADELPEKYPYVLGNCNVVSSEQILLPNGLSCFIDEKRYGGNGKIAIARSDGKCENCENEKNDKNKLMVHHNNGYSNNIEDLIVLCPRCHGTFHGQEEDMSDKSIEKEKEKEKEYIEEENIWSESNEKLKELLCGKFGITEIKFPQQFMLIVKAITLKQNKGQEDYDWFKGQCWFYFLYKELAKEKIHGFKTFMGELEELDKGAWNNENWYKKYEEVKREQKVDKPTTVQPSRTRRLGGSSSVKDLIPKKK